MAVITRAEVKTILGLTDTCRDDQIDMYIPIIEDDIKTYTNRDWGSDDFPWPVGMKPCAAMMANYLFGATSAGLKSENIGTYSYTRDTATNGYPDMIYAMLKKWRYLSTKSGTKQPQWRDRRGDPLGLEPATYYEGVIL